MAEGQKETGKNVRIKLRDARMDFIVAAHSHTALRADENINKEGE